MDKADQAIPDIPATGGGLFTREIAAVNGLTTHATRSRLLKLFERGIFKESGTSQQNPRQQYFRVG